MATVSSSVIVGIFDAIMGDATAAHELLVRQALVPDTKAADAVKMLLRPKGAGVSPKLLSLLARIVERVRATRSEESRSERNPNAGATLKAYAIMRNKVLILFK
jgi:hypothetical protein